MTDISLEVESPSLESAVDAVIVMDTDARIVDWSPAAEKLFGWPRQEAAGRLAPSLLIPDRLRETFWDKFQSLRSADPSDSPLLNNRLEVTCLKKSGEELVIELTVTALRLPMQNLILGIARDVWSLRKEEQTSTRWMMQTQLLQQATALSAMEDSFEETMQTCIESLCSTTNWPIGHALTPDESDQFLCSTDVWHIAEDDRLQSLDSSRFQEPFRRGQGLAGRIWETAKAQWMPDLRESGDQLLKKELVDFGLRGAFGFPVVVEGTVVAVLEFFAWEPITPDPPMLVLVENLKEQLGRYIERRQWMEERTRLAAIVDSSYDAIIGKDLEERIISWNSGAQQVYGYGAKEVLGHSIARILPEGMTEEESAIRNVIRTGRRLEQFEAKRRRKDGSTIHVALTVSPIRDSRGRIVGSSSIERDMTPRIRRERELRVAKREAEKANRTKSEFLANISHELRTPMNAILGMLNLSLGENLSDVLRDYLGTAHDSAQDLLYLLNDLLDFSRMEAGRFELDHEPFGLHETLNAAIRSLALRASEKGLELACHIDRNVPNRLLGDGMRVRQVIVNLVGNAVKFTDQGEVVARVEVVSQKSGRVRLRFSVQDTGIGISQEDQKQIFAPFTQVDASTTRTETGTGLGLAIVKELVGKMGGQIALDSEVGRGSRFHFEIPFEVLAATPREETKEKLQDLPVLVVDDNRTNQVILRESLASWEMRPTVVESAPSALEAIRSADEKGQPFPLIIVDALMPEVDGFMFLESLKEERDESPMPISVMMLSSADRQTFKKRCEDLEVTAYLEKPVSQSELLETILRVFDKSPLRDGMPRQMPPARRGMDVLLAEDTPANQKVVRAILEKRGHRVGVANNGREAVDLLRQHAFDIVLMDVQMPTMDGLQATRTIRDLPEDGQAAIPIIAMTAHARREDRRKCLDAGMDAYLAKPIDAQKLLYLVETVRRRPEGYQSSDTWDGLAVQTAAEKSTPLINLESARARMDGNEDLVNELAAFFLEDAPKLVAEIEQAVPDRHANAVQRAAHSLKGLAANFDAEMLIVRAINMEDAGRQADFEKAERLLPELRRSVRQVGKEFQSYLGANEKKGSS